MRRGISATIRAIAVLASLLSANLAAAQRVGGMGGMGPGIPAKEQFFANTLVAGRQEVIVAQGEGAKAGEGGDGIVIRSYPVRDLFTFRIVRAPKAADASGLIEIIKDAFIPTPSKDTDLPQIEFVEASGLLVIRQPAAVHEKIALLLTALRKARNQQVQKQPVQKAPSAPPPITVQTALAQAAEDRISALLEKPFAGKFEKRPLSEVLAEIARSTGLRILLDKRALAEASIAIDSPVTYEVSEAVPLRSALGLILKELTLAWAIDNESLLVTTSDKASRVLVTRVYPVLDMGSVPYPAFSKAVSYWSIVSGIRDWVSPTTWQQDPDPIGSFAPSASLVIAQSLGVHQQIARLLSTMRRIRDQQLAQDVPGRANETTQRALISVTVQTEAAQAAEERILPLLARPFSAKFEKRPLSEVLAEITQSTGLPICIGKSAREQETSGHGSRLALDTPVSCEVSNLSLRSALHLILGQLDLAYVIHDGLLLVATPEYAGSLEIIRVYPVRDLLSSPTAKGPQAAYAQQLNQLITDLIAPTTWDEVGGPGQQFFNAATSTFVIRQTLDVHEQIALLLTALRTAREQQQLAGDAAGRQKRTAEQALAPINVQTEAERLAEDRIQRILQRPFSGKYNQTPLAEILAEIKRSTGLPVQLDINKLADASIRVGVPVSCEVAERPLGSALTKILAPIKLAWTVDNEWVLVTTPEKASNLLVVRVYPVQDLISAIDPMNPRANRYEPLAQKISKAIAPTSWDEVGGPGGISQFNPSGALVISQTFEVHEKIAKLLAKLRKVRGHHAQQPDPAEPAGMDKPAAPSREAVPPGAGSGIF